MQVLFEHNEGSTKHEKHYINLCQASHMQHDAYNCSFYIVHVQ